MAKDSNLPMLPWFPRDYIAATRGWSLAERGAYCDLLFFSWDLGSLPNDLSRLARMLGVPIDEFQAVWPVMGKKFVCTPDGSGLVNERLERERIKSGEMRTNALERAKLGGASTKANWENDPARMARKAASNKVRQAAYRAKRKAASVAASPAQAIPQARQQAMHQAGLGEGSPSPSSDPSRDPTPERARNSEGETGKETHTYGSNGRGK
jgi:uncharacterized protein YdaU (DUF1376 family)